MTPAGVDRPARRERLEAGAARPSTSPTTTSSAPPSRATRDRVQEFWQTLYDKGDVYEGSYEGPYCVGLRGVQAPGRAASTATGRPRRAEAVPDPRPPGRDALRGELLLPAVRLRRPAARALRGATRTSSSPSQRPQRGRVVRPAGPAGPVDLAVDASTGASRCRGTTSTSSTCGSTRCSTTLTAAGYGDEAAAEKFAHTWPADVHLVGKDILRFHAVIWPAMLMAAGVAAAATGLRARLAAGRRREDEQVQAHRHPAERDRRRLRLGRVPLLLPAGHRVRPGRLVLLGGHERALHGRARQRARQPRVAGSPRWSAATSTACCPAPADEPELAAGGRHGGGGRRGGDRPARPPGRHPGGDGLRAASSTATSPSRSRGRSPRTSRAVPTSTAILYATAEALRAVAVLLNPVMPKATRAAVGARSAPRPRSGRWPTRGCRTPGAGASCPAGATVTKGEPLFPRLEEPGQA